LAVDVSRSGGDVLVATDPGAGSYAVLYGPLQPAQTGLHRFEVACTLTSGGVACGVLNGDQSAWMQAAVNRIEHRAERRFDVALDLEVSQLCWVVLYNNHPDGDGVSTFTIRQLAGAPSLTAGPSAPAPVAAPWRGWRWWARDRADDLGRLIAAKLARPL